MNLTYINKTEMVERGVDINQKRKNHKEGNEQEPRQNDTKTIYHDDYTCRLKIQTTAMQVQAFLSFLST